MLYQGEKRRLELGILIFISPFYIFSFSLGFIWGFECFLQCIVCIIVNLYHSKTNVLTLGGGRKAQAPHHEQCVFCVMLILSNDPWSNLPMVKCTWAKCVLPACTSLETQRSLHLSTCDEKMQSLGFLMTMGSFFSCPGVQNNVHFFSTTILFPETSMSCFGDLQGQDAAVLWPQL